MHPTRSRLFAHLAVFAASLVLAGCGGGGGIQDIVGGGGDDGPPPIKITVDGEFEDWERVPVAASEGTNGTDHPNGMDFTEVRIWHDEENLYFYVVSADRFRFPGALPGVPASDTPFLTCLVQLDLDDDGTFETGLAGHKLVHDGPNPQILNVVSIGPNALNGVASLTTFETSVPRDFLERFVRGITDIRVMVSSGFGKDEIPNNSFMRYTLD